MQSDSRRVPLAVAALLIVMSMGACGSDQPAVCSSVDALKASVDNLRNLNASENGLSELRTELDQVKKDLQQVANDAKQQYGSEIGTVRTSVATLEGSLNAARADPSAATFRPVVTDVADLGSAARALQQSVSTTCRNG